MKYKTYFFGFAALLLVSACNNSNQNKTISTDSSTVSTIDSQVKEIKEAPNEISVKVYVKKDGQIIVDRNPMQLSTLDGYLKELKKNNGVVWYSRDNPAGEPPAESMKVIDLVTKYGLSIRFYTDDTFSTAVKPE